MLLAEMALGAPVILAILVWLFLDSQITKTVILDCQLYYVNALEDDDRIIPDGVSTLQVRLPTSEFTPGAFLDTRDEPITQVSITFRGPDHLISTIEPGEQFFVRAQPSAGQSFLEFDLEDITVDRELRSALHAISPDRIKLELQPNGTKELPLSHTYVQVDLPEGDASLYTEKLELRDMTFNPSVIKLHGTKAHLDRVERLLRQRDPFLFRVDLSDRASDFRRREIQANLEPLPILSELQIVCDPKQPKVLIPLRPDWNEHEIRAPMSLESASFDRDHFEDLPRQQPLTLFVAGELANELTGLNADQIEAWTMANVRVLVSVPHTYNGVDPMQIEPKLVFLKHDNLELGRDYKFELFPIEVKPRNQ